MVRLEPGWAVAICAAGLAVSSWLPWLTTAVDGGGRASAIGGTVGGIVLPPRFGAGQLIVLLAAALIVLGAMVARRLSPRATASAAVAVSVLVAVLAWSYFRTNVRGPVAAGYGFYVGIACVAAVLACSVWAFVSTMRSR